ncbi:hypothetical protein [Saccharopolyspora sp. CA-218241]|uniref:hypothetical protein n=1 Tax=Saccharopolyspora sp. CA-218241 TaxID=3240027 RepID=UPI003D952C1E
MEPAVAASSKWTDEDGVRQPCGDVHGWRPGTNQALCGVPLHRAGLARFPHVSWRDARWLAGTAGARLRLCPRCDAAAGGRRGSGWTRRNPRP